MNIDTEDPHPKPVEQCLSLLKQLDTDISDIKVDILFIKSKIKETEEKREIEKLSGGWWLLGGN